ncbi:MAG: NYN domain-containing protein [Planctomycetota bacterium]
MSQRGSITYIVDGYNLLPKVLSEEERSRGLEAARALLEARLRALRSSAGGNVRFILVYDGALGAPGSRTSEPGFEVHFAKPPRKADDAILELSRKLEGSGAVCVVTSDVADIGGRIRGLRVSRASSEEFARKVIAALGLGTAPKEGEKPRTPSAEEAESWVEEFGLARFPPAPAARSTPEVEREVKFAIPSREDFLRLRDSPEWGAPGRTVRQFNYYFDTGDRLLGQNRILLRIREDAGPSGRRCTVTWKCGRETAPGVFESEEIEEEIPAAALDAARRDPGKLWEISPRVAAALSERIGRRPLGLAGSLENERTRREVGGWILELDRTSFPDGSENYELEIETDRPLEAKAWAEREVEGKGIRLAPERRTKYERLLARVGGARPASGGKESEPCAPS